MKQVTERDYQRRISAVQAHMEAHWDEPLSLEDLAAVACFSPYHFHWIYRAMVGETVTTTWRRIRLRKAADQLLSTPRSITEVAMESGYFTAQAFSRAFRADMGMSPSAYRRARGQGALVPAVPVWPGLHFEEIAMDVALVELAPMHLLSFRHLGPYQNVGEAFDRLTEWTRQAGLWERCIGVIGLSYDDPETVPAAELRYDACAEFAQPVDGADDIQPACLAGGRFALYRHVGPYDGINGVFRQLFGVWLPQSGFEPDDRPCMEIYRNDAKQTAPEHLVTDILIPLKV